MRIAVTCENNTVFQHFGHTPEFAIFEVEDGKIIAEKIISSGEEGHGALANVLAQSAVDVLVCGGTGCTSSGSQQLIDTLQAEIGKKRSCRGFH